MYIYKAQNYQFIANNIIIIIIIIIIANFFLRGEKIIININVTFMKNYQDAIGQH